MSLNFYASIDSYKVDSKGNLSLNVKLPAESLDHQIDKLQLLKTQGVIRTTLESAIIQFQQEVDIENGDTRYQYMMQDGKWIRKEIEQTSLLPDEENYRTESVEITADVVDRFLQTQKYDLKSKLDVKTVLDMVSEGYEFDEIAKKFKTTTTAMLNKLNEIRDEFAPYAQAWVEQEEKAKGDE